MNVVATGSGALVEVQGGGEGTTFTRSQLDAMLELALGGLERIGQLQRHA
jgi:ribonuclease PH